MQLLKYRHSDNVASVKHFLGILTRALRKARHFALVEGSAIPTKARTIVGTGFANPKSSSLAPDFVSMMPWLQIAMKQCPHGAPNPKLRRSRFHYCMPVLPAAARAAAAAVPFRLPGYSITRKSTPSWCPTS
jgi:hypothetical protein